MTDLDLPDISGGWIARDVIVAERAFHFVVPAEPESFLKPDESAAAAATSIQTSYWQYLWPAATDMARLVMGAVWKTGQEALELGSGVGLVGVAALAAGLSVTFSDCDPVAVQVALTNARRNGFHTAKGLLLDWTAPVSHRFPVILASDVLYHPQHIPPILRSIDSMLEEGGVCWIGDPGRWSVPAFLSAVTKAGYEIHLRNSDGRDVLFPAPGQFVLIELRRG
ncbi:MAG: methyltransferase [Planctomycetales bacterium]|nr:methyltransferase [Planctomycetales bacterium]